LNKYYLNKDIHVVLGAKKHCIYDLQKGRLFSIDQSALDMLNRFLSIDEKLLTKDETNFLNELLKYGIITKEKQAPPEIPVKEPKLNFAWIEVTKTCNHRCIHCYNDAEYQIDSSKRHMEFSDFCRVIDMLHNMGVPRIQLIGGEPYVLEGLLPKMLSYVKGKFQFIEIFTNGTLLKESDFDDLINNGVSQIALSVYSNSPEEHDKVTKVQGSHRKMQQTINTLKRINLPYRIANVRMKDINVNEKAGDIIEPKSGYDFVRLSGRGNLNLYDSSLLKEKLITKKYFKKKISSQYVKRNMGMHNCFSNKAYIDIDLNVYPCVMERRISHGNIVSENLESIMKGWIITHNKDKISECCDCEYRYACHDCRPDSLSDDVNAKPWYCTYNPYEGKWCDIDEFITNLEV
jgi:radical SAM protein with 4Fe4S-binding SPASM domain